MTVCTQCMSGDKIPGGYLGSEFALLNNLLYGLSECHLSITTGQALPGEKIKSCCLTAHQTLTFNLSCSKCYTTSMHGDLKQVWVSCGSAPLIVRVTLSRALWPVPSSALPQVLQRCTTKTVPDLEAVGEQENLPVLLQFHLDLNTTKAVCGLSWSKTNELEEAKTAFKVEGNGKIVCHSK